jgi:hypothetical protein
VLPFENQRKSGPNFVCQIDWRLSPHGTVANRIRSVAAEESHRRQPIVAAIRATAGSTCAQGQWTTPGDHRRWAGFHSGDPSCLSLYPTTVQIRTPVIAAVRPCAACPNRATASPWPPLTVYRSPELLPRHRTRTHARQGSSSSLAASAIRSNWAPPPQGSINWPCSELHHILTHSATANC